MAAIKKYLTGLYLSAKGGLARPALPISVFLLCFFLTAFLTKMSSDSERQARIQQTNFDAKEITKNIELRLLNDTLRLQIHLDNYDMSRYVLVRKNADIIEQLLTTTIFQRASIFVEKKNKSNQEPELVRAITIRTPQDTLPFDQKQSGVLKSAYLKKKILGMQQRNVRTAYSMSHVNDQSTLSLMWRSQFRNGEYTVLTTPIRSLFGQSKERKNLYAILSDPELNLSLMAYWDRSGNIQVSADEKQIEKAQAEFLFLNQSPLISGNSSIKIDWFMPPAQNFSAVTLTIFFAGVLISILFSVFLHLILLQNRRISQLVVTRTMDLERAVSDAQEANLAKTRFLANMSHELRTPLNIILGMTELIENKVNDAKTLEFISTMRSAGDHLLSLITDVLSMSKEESVDINIKSSPITTIVFIEEIGRLIGPDCRKNGLAFDLQPAHDLPAVIFGDPARVRQILTNLLKNALKYTRQGFVSLRISKVNHKINRPGFASLRFEVIDSGIGIPKEKKQEIFNRFFQLEGAKILADGGVGLGLSIVKELLGKMGGQIQVESEIGKGSTFTVDLDFEIKDARPWIEDFNYKTLTDKKILVVENELDISFKYRMLQLLGLPGFKVETCTFADLTRAFEQNKLVNYYRVLLMANSAPNFSFLDSKDIQLSQKFIFVSNEDRSTETTRLTNYGKVIDNSPVLPTRLFAALEIIQPRRRATLRAPAGTTEEIQTPNADRTLSILVADDDLTNQDLLRAYFDGKPWKTLFTNNGLEALEAYRKNPPDVVIADFRMPILDGFEMAKSIREHELSNKLKMIPIVIVTADALEETEKRAIAIPNTTFLTKPVRRTRLLEAIHTVAN